MKIKIIGAGSAGNHMAHALTSIKNVKKIEIDEIKSEILKNFYKESKKVSNKKIKNYFNYKLKFPSYIEGLSYIRDNIIGTFFGCEPI